MVISFNKPPSDADTLIFTVALDVAREGGHATVVADDTDVLILLPYHWMSTMAEVFMKRQARGRYSGTLMCIKLLQDVVGLAIVRRLLVIHAISGCDTTSAVFGHRNVPAFNRLCSGELSEFFETIGSPVATKSEERDAGRQLLVELCGDAVGVDKMRYTMYMKLCSSSKTAIVPEQLPPTQRAAYFHCLRVHLQVLQ
jgi:hypothetical protein